MKSDLQGIRAFDALYKHHSVTAAAKALNQPKSTLSRRLAQLESEMGQVLFFKQGNKLVMTRAGSVFASYCQNLLTLAEETGNALQALNQEISGEITILSSPNLIRGWLRQVLDSFLDEHPLVNVRLLTEMRESYVKQEPDIILSIGELATEPTWRKRMLGRWDFALYTSEHFLSQFSPITHPNQLESHRWVPFNHDQSSSIALYKGLEQHSLYPKMNRLISDNLLLQIDSIINQHHIGILPTWIAENYNRKHEKKLQHILPQWQGKSEPIMCYYASGIAPLRVTTLLDSLKNKTPSAWLKRQTTQNLSAYQEVLLG